MRCQDEFAAIDAVTATATATALDPNRNQENRLCGSRHGLTCPHRARLKTLELRRLTLVAQLPPQFQDQSVGHLLTRRRHIARGAGDTMIEHHEEFPAGGNDPAQARIHADRA